jgi:glutathione S-transferase
MVLKLYHGSLGGMSLRVSVVLTELQIPFEWAILDILKRETKTEEHFKRQPFGLVPVLVRYLFTGPYKAASFILDSITFLNLYLG